MKKSMMLIIGVVVIVVLTVGVFAAIKHNKTTSNTMNNASMDTMNMNSASSSSSSATSESINNVTIQNFAFSPSSITVKKGTKVTWTNKDGVAHTVTETDGQTGPDSDDVNPGATYSFTFNTVGTFNYHCAIHPSMTGKVIVTE